MKSLSCFSQAYLDIVLKDAKKNLSLTELRGIETLLSTDSLSMSSQQVDTVLRNLETASAQRATLLVILHNLRRIKSQAEMMEKEMELLSQLISLQGRYT